MSDLIDRQQAIDALAEQMPRPFSPDGSHPADDEIFMAQEIYADCIQALEVLPSEQPEYKPVTVEDFAKTLSENTIYGFMAWHGEAFTLIKEMGFEICKKTM